MLLLITGNKHSYAQVDLTQVPGKLYRDSRKEATKPRIKALFQVMETLAFFSQPKGMDIQENYIFYNSQGNNGSLIFSMNEFYRDQFGKIHANTEESPAVSVILNKPGVLMDENSIFNNVEQSSLPVMFTDTFALTYSELNGYRIGQCIDHRFKNKMFIINPRQSALFRPVNREEYLKYYIGKLNAEIKEDSLHQIEMKEELAPLKINPSLKATLEEVQKINDAMLKYDAFKKKKKQFYEKKLAALSPSEKKQPAYRLGHKDVALPLKDGKPLNEISGHLEYEPDEENEDLMFKLPIFTFNNSFIDKKLPDGAITLIVITSPFKENDVHAPDLKEVVEREVFPNIPYKFLAERMYQ
ncbi:hypothetical protein [Flavisolibacter ginsengisoli]|uniref:hypothetical protein n=1 Tax=Flavisolibacter ginsengisoli TaxID=462367 RepID=UPI001C319660|nr:hypothetical protein [Flavisolibacter ginsengisoli]